VQQATSCQDGTWIPNTVDERSNGAMPMVRQRIHWGVYIGLIATGITMAALSLFNKASATDLTRNWLSLLCNLGSGMLGAGATAWLLDSMHARLDERIVQYRRECVLRDVRGGIQAFLNESANKYFDLNRLVHGKPIEPRKIGVSDILKVVREFEKTFLHQYGNNQVHSEIPRAYIANLYGQDSSIRLLGDIASRVLSSRDAYIATGVLLREEVDMLDAARSCAENAFALTSRGDYVRAVAFVDALYARVGVMIGSIKEFQSFEWMTFVNYTIRNRE